MYERRTSRLSPRTIGSRITPASRAQQRMKRATYVANTVKPRHSKPAGMSARRVYDFKMRAPKIRAITNLVRAARPGCVRARFLRRRKRRLRDVDSIGGCPVNSGSSRVTRGFAAAAWKRFVGCIEKCGPALRREVLTAGAAAAGMTSAQEGGIAASGCPFTGPRFLRNMTFSRAATSPEYRRSVRLGLVRSLSDSPPPGPCSHQYDRSKSGERVFSSISSV